MAPNRPPQLNDYKNLGRGPTTSYFRKLVLGTGAPAGKGTFARLKSFTSQIQNWPAWAWHVIEYAGASKYPYQTYPQNETGIFLFGNVDTLAVAGDWGTGTPQAQQVADKMEARNPAYSIHLGDVYYVGDTQEVTEHCLGQPTRWKPGTKGSFFLIGNHEMYGTGKKSGQLGGGFFEDLLNSATLGTTQQHAGFFCLRNDYWDIIGLDTGYNSTGVSSALSFLSKIPGLGSLRKSSWFKPSCKLPPELMAWLPGVLGGGAPTRGLILLTHHQCYSSFEDWYPTPAQQLQPLIKRPVLWFWGHEHRLAIYDQFAVDKGIPAFGRCIGHGGMPVQLGTPKANTGSGDCKCMVYDARVYDPSIDAGFNGYVTLTFSGQNLQVDYLDLNDARLLTEQWSVDNAGVLQGPHFSNPDPGLQLPAGSLP